MNAEDIYNGLLALVAELNEREFITNHKFRYVGDRRSPTELRVWFESGLVLHVVGPDPIHPPLSWAVHPSSGDVLRVLASSYRIQTDEPTRYQGRDWMRRLVEDVSEGLMAARQLLG